MLMAMEFLDLQIDEMDAIEKVRQTYDYPVVTFYKFTSCYVAVFNRQARKMLENYAWVKIYANAEYVVFQPSDKKDYHSYKITCDKTGHCRISCAKFERLMLDRKTFKLYNTKKGLAIKINDPIQNRK